MAFFANLKQYITIENILIFALFAISIFIKDNGMIDSYLAPKKYFTTIAALVLIITFSLKLSQNKLPLIKPKFCYLSIAILCSIEACYTILQWTQTIPRHGIYKITGHFDNPAGLISCLCIGLPFIIYI